ncbi:MAG: RnfABCDGE type electron transport complex subunit C [Clostridiales bacterium]|nr:RnfABCDGE type electron transport complex subunit C [Clostridiales bacterium]
MLQGRHVYSFYKGFHSDNALDFSKRSSSDRDVMLERIYPRRIILPMCQHRGDPCVPVVKVGETVTIGQCVGAPAPGTMAVPVHSGISGEVTAIKPVVLPDGRTSLAVFIEGNRKRTFHPSVRPRNNVNVSAATVMGIIRDAGIVGMGGEGIPTIVKLNRARRLKVKEILVNCLQSEPYAESDHLMIGEYADHVIMGAVAMAGACGVRIINILISKDRKYEITALRSAMERSFSMYSGYAFNFVYLKPRFPQGYYRMVARALYEVNLEEGESLEQRCRAVMFNCSTVYACWNAISESMPLTSRVISISNEDGLVHNVIAPIGTPVSELYDNVNGVSSTSKRIIWGNLMTGIEIDDPENTPILKTTSGICLLTHHIETVAPCTGCERCVDVCPLCLEPDKLYRMIRDGNQKTADKFNAGRCISCGACSYICPSNIDLATVVGGYASALRGTGSFPYNSVGDTQWTDDVSLLSADQVKVTESKHKSADEITLPFKGWDA